MKKQAPEGSITIKMLALLYGVTYPVAYSWRRHPGFPKPVGKDGKSELFNLEEFKAWHARDVDAETMKPIYDPQVLIQLAASYAQVGKPETALAILVYAMELHGIKISPEAFLPTMA